MRTHLVLISLAIFSSSALAGEPPKQPLLQLDTGRHHAVIGELSIDAQERWLLTASWDHTARLWDLHTGEMLHVFRLPEGETGQDMIFGAALSPDGSLAAIGGWSGYEWDDHSSVYLFERATGRLIRRIGDLPQSVRHLVFSRDGTRLLVCLGAGNYYQPDIGGMRVYSVPDGVELARDDYDAESNDGDIGPDGSVVTARDDGYVSLYEPGSYRLIDSVRLTDHRVQSTRFSPEGTEIAVASRDVSILSVRDLAVLARPSMKGLRGRVFALSWSADGGLLFAGGELSPGSASPYVIRRWGGHGRGRHVDLPCRKEEDSIGDIATTSTGLVYGEFRGSWTSWTVDGHTLVNVASPVTSLIGERLPAGEPRSGDGITFQYTFADRQLYAYSPAHHAVRPISDTAAMRDYYEAPGTTKHLKLAHAKPEGVLLNAHKLSLPEEEDCTARAVASDESFFVLGCAHVIAALNPQGRVLWYKNAASFPEDVNLSRDNRLVIVPAADGTFRWYRASDGEELLAFFPHADRKRWVAWTPSGYYDASVGGADLIGWHVNNGKDAPPDFFPASTFRTEFYRPDIVARVLQTLDERKAIDEANAAAARAPSELAVSFSAAQVAGTTDAPTPPPAVFLPPVVTLLAPQADTSFTNPHVTVRARIRSPSHEPITAVRLLVDGRPLLTVTRPSAVDPETNDADLLQGITLPTRSCALSVLAETAGRAGTPATIRLSWSGSEATLAERTPMLHVLSLGDAQPMAEALSHQRGAIQVRTRAALLNALDTVSSQAWSGDVVAVLLAGRGENDPRTGVLRIVTDDGVISAADLAAKFRGIAARVMVLVDACGTNLDLDGFAQDLISAEAGAAVIALGAECSTPHHVATIAQLLSRRDLTFDSLAHALHQHYPAGIPLVSARPSTVPDFALATR